MDLNHNQNEVAIRAAIRPDVSKLCRMYGLSYNAADLSEIVRLKIEHPQLSDDILLVSYFSSRHMNTMVDPSELANITGIRTEAVTNYNGKAKIASGRADRHGNNLSFFLRNHPKNEGKVMVVPLKGDITLGWCRRKAKRGHSKYYRECGERSDTKAKFLDDYVKECWKAVGGKWINVFAFEDCSRGQFDEENNTWDRVDITSYLASNAASRLIIIRTRLLNQRNRQLQEEADQYVFEGAPLHIRRSEQPNAPPPSAETQLVLSRLASNNEQLTGVVATQQQQLGELGEFVSSQRQTNEQLTSLLASHQQNLGALNARVNDMDNRHQQDMVQVRGDMVQVRGEVAETNARVESLQARVDEYMLREEKKMMDKDASQKPTYHITKEARKRIQERDRSRIRNQAATVPNEDANSLVLPEISELPSSSVSFLEGKTAVLKGGFDELTGGKEELEGWLKRCGVIDLKTKMFKKFANKYILIAGTGNPGKTGIDRAKEIGASWFRLPDFVERLMTTLNDDAEETLEPTAFVLSTPRRRTRGQDENAANEAPQQDEDVADEDPDDDEELVENEANEVPEQDEEEADVADESQQDDDAEDPDEVNGDDDNDDAEGWYFDEELADQFRAQNYCKKCVVHYTVGENAQPQFSKTEGCPSCYPQG